MRKSLIPAIIIAAAVMASAMSDPDSDKVVGTAIVEDGDNIHIGDINIRLQGIDAPSLDQTCQTVDGEIACGQVARSQLEIIVAEKTVSCVPISEDKYGRTVAVCTADGLDLAAEMVAQGWAVAYRKFSEDYVPQEDEARAEKRGLWSGAFVDPRRWRTRRRVSEARDHADCPIKGDLDMDGGKFYYTPDDTIYDLTVIDETHGERWFCSAEEAEAAGWSKAPDQ